MKRAKTLSDREIRAVLRSIAIRPHPVRNRAIILTSFLAGLRVGEIAALKIGDVYDNDRNVRSEFVLDRDQTKGGRRRRVFLNGSLRQELQSYLLTLAKPNAEKPLFVSQKGQAFSANTMCQLFMKFYADARVDGASSHSGRRTFITNLDAKGVSVRALAELAGHANIATTQRYIDVNDNQLRNAVELIG